MAARTDDGGLSRQDLARSLARLSQQYAGTGLAYTDLDGRIIGGERLAVNPADLPGLGPLWGGTKTATLPPPPPGAAGRQSTGPYDLAGDGGAWGPTGINLHNPYLARGDMANPFGPGARLDDYGTPFHRWDYIMTPQGPKIRGEDGYAGDAVAGMPLMTKEELAKYGIIIY